METKRVQIWNQGCRLNQAESTILEREFEANGYIIVSSSESADFAVINTCTVTENGDKDAKRLVNKITKQSPDAKIALIGCMAQIQKEALLSYPNVQWVVGNQDKMRLAQIIETSGDTPQVIAPKIKKESFSIETPGVDLKHKRANLKIQDGCDFFCAFCTIPFARGPARSRSYEDIFKEAQVLVEKGHKELVLTGINIGTYQDSGKTIMDVIQALEGVPNLSRIRISSIEPTTIPEALLLHMANSKTICPYLHIPIQSASDEVLKGMARKYTVPEFDRFIQFAKQVIPNVCIGTDVIVGFPGETDALFQETYDYLLEAPIDYFHVFSYSEREMARSKRKEGQVSGTEIKRRSEALRELGHRKRLVFQDGYIGTTQKVLVEQKKKGLWQGLTDNFIRVQFESDEDLENQWAMVRLIRNDGAMVFGEHV